MQSLEEVQKSFEESPFFAHVGFVITRFHEGDVLLTLPIHEHLYNVNGTLHGGVHATMIDLVLGMAIRSKTRTRCTTMNLNMNYLAPAQGGEIYATGKIIQEGFKIVTAEGELRDQSGKMLAKGIGTFKLIRGE